MLMPNALTDYAECGHVECFAHACIPTITCWEDCKGAGTTSIVMNEKWCTQSELVTDLEAEGATQHGKDMMMSIMHAHTLSA